MIDKDIASGMLVSNKKDFFCEACQYGKSHRLTFSKDNSDKVTRKPGEYFHTDLCEPMQTESLGKAKYFLLFKNDATGYKYVYFLKWKSDVYDAFEGGRMVNNLFGQPMKFLRSNNGREFCNISMQEYLSKVGIVLETTAPHTPQQNAASERENRTVVESARTMFHAKQLPYFLWAEAVNTVVYLQNRMPNSRTGNSTPYEKWYGKKPSLCHLKSFGTEAYVHIPKIFRRKLDSKATKMLFVGYDGHSSNYRLFNPETRKVVQSRDVLFMEESVDHRPKDPDVAMLPLPDNSWVTPEEAKADEALNPKCGKKRRKSSPRKLARTENVPGGTARGAGYLTTRTESPHQYQTTKTI